MKIRRIRGGTILFFLLFVGAVTWPGMILGNRTFPLVLGLPFSMVWIASWVLASFLVLLVLDLSEGRAGFGEPPPGPDSGRAGSGIGSADGPAAQGMDARREPGRGGDSSSEGRE